MVMVGLPVVLNKDVASINATLFSLAGRVNEPRPW
jgi:hypothetical protein